MLSSFLVVNLLLTPLHFRAADVDERITASSNTGWPYLERLKSAVRSRTTACFPGTSPTLRVAWAEGIDKVVHVAACEAAIEAASKPTLYFAAAAASATAATATSGAAKGKGGKSSAAAPPASVAPSAASLLGIDPDVLLPSSVRISRNRRAAVAAVQAHEDLFDCAILPLVTQGSVAAMAGAWPLREWVSPQTHAEWVATTAWPRERAHSVLMLRVIELREFLDRVTACEDYVFSLFLGGGDAGCVGGGGLPSHLDIEVVLSRLPNCARLELCYGVLDRAVAPLSGFALPLEDDDEDGSSGRAGLASLVVPPDAVVAGMLPHDLLPLTRCLRATTSLTTLVLSRNNLDDALTAQLASALAINSTVCELNVSHNLIGSAGMEALARLFLHSYAGGRRCMITRLDVSHNAGDARAGAAFASALRACPTLQQLVLSRNALGDGGASAVLAAVAGHTGCKHLELAGCGLGAAAAATIAAALSVPGTALVTLDMSANATAWGSSSTDTSTAVAALCSAVIASQAAGVGATRLRMCNVRPAFEPAALHDALRANTLITSSSCGPLLLV